MVLSEISIRRPVFAWMLMLALIVFGAISFHRMGISHMPDVNFPVVNISLRLDNAAPEVMESTVVDVIEDAVMGIEGLKNVSSSTSQGIANITCEFVLDHNIDVALQEVQNRISQVSNLLPTNLYPPVITKTNPEDQPIMWVMVTADDHIPLYKQMIYARNTVKDQLSSVGGVGDIVLAGYVDPNLRVWIDRKKLKYYDLTSSDIINAITSEQIEQPAGRIEADQNEMNIRVFGEAQTPEEFGNIRINNRGGAANFKPIPLSSVARIEEGISDLRAISRFNGKTSVGLGIVKQHGANAVQVSKLIYQKVEQMKSILLPGYHINVQLDTTKYIKESVNQLNMALLFSAILTSLVCYGFLGSWSSTINVLFAIPTSIVGSFTVLYFFGFTLNTFTLLGLSLAIGIVVDDAIMMLENIVRHYEMGKDRIIASLDGSREITFAAVATTIAIIAIFIPVIFMKGVVGHYFYQYGITITAAVSLSLLEALTLTPMRCSRFLRSAKHGNEARWTMKKVDHFMDWLSHLYKKILALVLNHRLIVVITSLIFFGVSILFVSTLRKELIPKQDQSLFLLSLRTTVGSSINATDEIFKKAETYLKKQNEVESIYTTIGNFENNNIVNAGTIYVILKDPKKRKLDQREIMDRTRTDLTNLIKGVQITMQDLSLTGFSATRGFPVEFIVEGPDWKKLLKYTESIKTQLKQTGLVEDLNSAYQDGMPEVLVRPDRIKASNLGVSINTIGQEVSSMAGGQLFNANTQYPKEGHRYYIRIRADEFALSKPSDLENILLRNNRGNLGDLISLSKTSTIETTTGPQLISRYNRQRAVPVFGNVVKDKSQQEAIDATLKIGKKVLPEGYRMIITGSATAFHEAFQSLIFALILGIAVSYMVLASQFNSFIHPVAVLMALPFSVSGALLALFLGHQSLSLFSMIGLILLMGIVKKNSILLVDFTNQKRNAGMSPHEALMEACPVRLRPILMTSVATIAGAIPEALNFGAGFETRIPMAISIIGGVSVSTLLTLFVVPCVYSLFTQLERSQKEKQVIK